MRNENVNKLNFWIFGYQISQAIFIAAELSIADFLESGLLDYNTLALQAKCHPEALHRLLRVL